jgi:hypothetical protein
MGRTNLTSKSTLNEDSQIDFKHIVLAAGHHPEHGCSKKKIKPMMTYNSANYLVKKMYPLPFQY